jgi:hypothetical protein
MFGYLESQELVNSRQRLCVIEGAVSNAVMTA